MLPQVFAYFFRARFSRRMRFFRHFQRIFLLFFQSRELRFMFSVSPVICSVP
jgi:hypothetical protein